MREGERKGEYGRERNSMGDSIGEGEESGERVE